MKRTLTVIAVAVAAAAAGGAWYLHAKQPLRNGSLALAHLQAPVDVRYDERGVPHLYAQNQTDLYRALGYVHAQDRLFQMEMLRRLARGELAEVLGPKLVDTDRLFRTLRIRDHAAEYSARQDKQSQPWKVLEAYLDGVNQFQENNPAPLEFDLLGIPRRPFTPEDTLSIAGYMAYSFAAAFRTEPVLTYIRDELGSDYLRIFDLDWHPQGVLTPSGALGAGDWKDLGALARLSQQALEDAGLPQFEGSNAWVVAGSRTASGKPLLAGDPHIRFAAPAVWYEAQLSAPGFELYGHHQALNPFASLGHNRAFGWSLTMFQNDDLDLVAEKVNPDNPNQVWYQGEWVDLQSEEQEIAVKGAAPVKLTLRRSPHGPIVNDALGASSGKTPIAMWWAFLETENPVSLRESRWHGEWAPPFYQSGRRLAKQNRMDTRGIRRHQSARLRSFVVRQRRQGTQRMLVAGAVESAVGGEHGVDLVGQHVGHHAQRLVALVADQGQLVEHGARRRRILAFDLVLDGLDQFFLGEAVFLVVVLFAHRAFLVLAQSTACAAAGSCPPCLANGWPRR